MKYLKVLVLFGCLAFSPSIFAQEKAPEKAPEKPLEISKDKSDSLPETRPESIIGNTFVVRKPTKLEPDYIPCDVTYMSLSQSTLAAYCESGAACENKSRIDVLIKAAQGSRKIITSYYYTVSGGKIVGAGANVIWDLTGVKPGEYTITSAVDDGCGFCGKTVTEKITVKECADCKTEAKEN